MLESQVFCSSLLKSDSRSLKRRNCVQMFLIFCTEKVNYVFISFLLERIRNTTKRADTGAALEEESLRGGTEALVGDISAQFRKAYPQSSAFLTVLRRAVQKPRLLVSHWLCLLLLFLGVGTSPRKSDSTVFPSKSFPTPFPVNLLAYSFTGMCVSSK